MTRKERLVGLRTQLDASMQNAVETAAAIDEPAGRSAAWSALCAWAGVAELSDAERTNVRAAQRPTRGAPLAEVVAVTTAIGKWARVELRAIGWMNETDEEERLRRNLELYVDECAANAQRTYEDRVLPPRGGMFANVLAHASATPTAAAAPATVTVRCKACGAPRAQVTATCTFCHTPF